MIEATELNQQFIAENLEKGFLLPPAEFNLNRWYDKLLQELGINGNPFKEFKTDVKTQDASYQVRTELVAIGKTLELGVQSSRINIPKTVLFPVAVQFEDSSKPTALLIPQVLNRRNFYGGAVIYKYHQQKGLLWQTGKFMEPTALEERHAPIVQLSLLIADRSTALAWNSVYINAGNEIPKIIREIIKKGTKNPNSREYQDQHPLRYFQK
jgi:hypothetical protein